MDKDRENKYIPLSFHRHEVSIKVFDDKKRKKGSSWICWKFNRNFDRKLFKTQKK